MSGEYMQRNAVQRIIKTETGTRTELKEWAGSVIPTTRRRARGDLRKERSAERERQTEKVLI